MDRLTKTYSDGTHGASDSLPCGENSYDYKNLLIEKLGKYEDSEERGKLIILPYNGIYDGKGLGFIDSCIATMVYYEDLQCRLAKIYGKCDRLLEQFVRALEDFSSPIIPKDTIKSLLITNEDVDKYEEYQQLEEQGKLIKIPCKIGDDVWFVPSQTNYKLNILNHHREENKICHQKVARITFIQNGWYLECDKDLEYATGYILIDNMYKETWFLTQEEAEAKLKELR